MLSQQRTLPPVSMIPEAASMASHWHQKSSTDSMRTSSLRFRPRVMRWHQSTRWRPQRRQSVVHAEYTFCGRRLKFAPRASIRALWSRHGPDGSRTLWLPQAGGEECEAMNTSVRARRGARGFSFVELLVTIIIAGIAFAAMVPLFVQAQQKNSADNVRNISLQIAQDKIEKIRQLSSTKRSPMRVWKARPLPAVSSARRGTSASPAVRPGRSLSSIT